MGASASTDRLYFLDRLRCAALGLLIVHHCELPYLVSDWLTKSIYEAPGTIVFGSIIEDWQMPLLYMVAGAATRVVIARNGAGEAAMSRLKRILPAIILAMAVLTPFQHWEAVRNGRDITVFPEGYQLFQHVWFLPFLLLYALLAAWAYGAAAGRMADLERGLQRLLDGPGVLIAPALFIIPGSLLGVGIERSHAIWSDPIGHIRYGGLFVLGLMAGPVLWPRFERYRVGAAVVAVAAAAAKVLIDGTTNPYGNAAAAGILGAAMIVALTGFARRYFNRPGPILTALNRGVMPVYLLHQPVILALVPLLTMAALGRVGEQVALTIGAFVVSAALYVVIDRVPPVAFWFGLPPRRRKQQSLDAAPQQAAAAPPSP